MTYGVKEICERYEVGEHTVLGWINSGELKAINVSRKRGTRPKWRVTPEALAEFELSRMPSPPEQSKRRKRKRKRTDVIEFIK